MTPNCRFCGASLHQTLVDLGETPLANSYLKDSRDIVHEKRYPLHARVCTACWLVQVETPVAPQNIFGDYAYFSSYSDTWSEHARRFAVRSIGELKLTERSLVVEVASNDGYLLRHYVAAGIPVLGVEPAKNVAAEAIQAGIPTDIAFFGADYAQQLYRRRVQANLLVANNVLAHVPDINDFAAGLAAMLQPESVLTIEVPHLLRLIEGVQFDTIYHEHCSYFSLLSVEQILAAHGMAIYDVEELPTHGGSLRLWVRLASPAVAASARVIALRQRELLAGLNDPATYESFAGRVAECRDALLDFFSTARTSGKDVVGYGAAAKGNTLLNYCALTDDDVAYVVDRSPHKQGTLLPGSHIPVYAPERVTQTRPAYVLVLPWNIHEEISEQMAHIREWGGRLVIPVPSVRIE